MLPIWEGEKLTKNEAFETSGIKQAPAGWMKCGKIIESLVTIAKTFTIITMSITINVEVRAERIDSINGLKNNFLK